MSALAEPSAFLRARAEAMGLIGTKWLTSLPTRIAELERRWGIQAVAVLEGGTASHVLEARTAGGERVILKLGLPTREFGTEIDALHLADGDGYVKLLETDRERGAMLLETLGRSLSASALPPAVQLDILGQMIRRGWGRQVPSDTLFETQDKAADLGTAIADFRLTLDHGCDDAVFETCAEYASRLSRAFARSSPVLLHGDAAAANVLQVLEPRPGAELGWVFVDPEPFVGDATYDLGVAARDWCDELLAAGAGARDLMRHYCDVLAQASGADAQQIWEWAFLERVSTGLFVLSFGAKDFARPFFASAERILA